MKSNSPRAARAKRAKRNSSQWTKAELESLVDEAAVDCYNESEQVGGFYTAMQNDLAVPFETEIFGAVVVGGNRSHRPG